MTATKKKAVILGAGDTAGGFLKKLIHVVEKPIRSILGWFGIKKDSGGTETPGDATPTAA